MDLPTLVYRRDMIEVYKYLHGIYTVNSSSMLPLDQSRGPVTRGHAFKLAKRGSSCVTRSGFFSMRVVNEWNGLPSDVVTAETVNCFKNRLDRHWRSLRFSTDDACFCH